MVSRAPFAMVLARTASYLCVAIALCAQHAAAAPAALKMVESCTRPCRLTRVPAVACPKTKRGAKDLPNCESMPESAMLGHGLCQIKGKDEKSCPRLKDHPNCFYEHEGNPKGKKHLVYGFEGCAGEKRPPATMKAAPRLGVGNEKLGSSNGEPQQKFTTMSLSPKTDQDKMKAGALFCLVVFCVGMLVSCCFLWGGRHGRPGHKSNSGLPLLPFDKGPDHSRFPKHKHSSCCAKLCFILMFPFVCVTMPIFLYLMPCLYYTFHKTFGRFFFWLFVEKLGRGAECFMFTDKSFCGDEALGEGENSDGEVEWKRVHEINPDIPFKDLMLFGSEIDADDVAQGLVIFSF